MTENNSKKGDRSYRKLQKIFKNKFLDITSN